MANLNNLAHEVDALLDQPMAVVGSLPDDARDLDLFGPSAALNALAAKLEREGFRCWRGAWFSILDGRCRVVELCDAEGFGLPVPAIDSIREGMVPLAGFRSLCQPAPAHSLLLLARRAGCSTGPIEPKWRSRIERALREDPHLWDEAAAEAGLWGLEAELRALEEAWSSRDKRPRAAARALRARLRVTWPGGGGHVVAVSGIDGTGKSTQVQVLADAFRSLGLETRTVWTRITYSRALRWISGPVKVVLGVRRWLALRSTPAPDFGPQSSPMRGLRSSSRLVGDGWVTIVALVDAVVLRRTTRRHVRRGRMVFRDRYVLDSVVQLLDQYGHEHQVQARLLRRLAPRPLCAFLLDTPPEVAWDRKPEEFSIVDLARHRDSYRSRAREMGVRVVDADRARDEISMDLVEHVCRKLG